MAAETENRPTAEVRRYESSIAGLMPWRIGAVLGKEMRVASRRRRSFVLRFGYLALMTGFVALVWLSVVRFEDEASAASRIMRMSQAGATIIACTVWFQFVAAQLVAVLLLSTSFSEEIRRGTMGPLLSTPLTNSQIIAGKLLGGTGQVLVLLGISFPLLTIVRVFGGVPWGFVVGSFCTTVTACIFAGTITMLYSIVLKRTHLIILASLGTLAAWNLVVAAVLALTCVGTWAIPFVSPFGMMGVFTYMLFDPGSLPWVWYLWPLHCAAMLGFTSVGVLLCARAVRRTAMRRAFGEPIFDPVTAPAPPARSPADAAQAAAFARLAAASVAARRSEVVLALPAGPAARPPAKPPPLSPAAPATAPFLPAPPPGPLAPPAPGEIRRVIGSPLLWREMNKPLFADPTVRTVVLIVAGVVLLMAYVFLCSMGAMGERGVQAFFLLLYVVPATFCTLLLSATTVAPEKESRCWPLLLTTTLTDGYILRAKVAGVLRRALPAWAPLPAHAGLCALFVRLHPAAPVYVLLIAVGAVAFILGLGTYVSARVRRTTTALVATVGLLVTLWGVLPLGVWLTRDILRDRPLVAARTTGGPSWSDLAIRSGPVAQCVVVADGAIDPDEPAGPTVYDWGAARTGPGATAAWLACWAGVYVAAGALLLWRAKARFRRDVF